MSRWEFAWGAGRAAFFIVAAVALAVGVDSGRGMEWDIAILLGVAYAVLWNVELEIGLGATVPVFLATVPMLFLLPTETVPLICLVAALAQESRTRAGFMRRALGTTWSHLCLLGPVAVLLATGSEVANWSDWYIYIAALAVVRVPRHRDDDDPDAGRAAASRSATATSPSGRPPTWCSR